MTKSIKVAQSNYTIDLYKRSWLSLLFLILLSQTAYAFSPASLVNTDEVEHILKKTNSKSYFEENLGQWDENIIGTAQSKNIKARFFNDKVSFIVASEDANDVFVYNMIFSNIHAEAELEFVNKKTGKKNYIGCVDEVSTFEEVRYKNLYPKIDLRFYINLQGKMEFDYIVYPGGDPTQIAYKLDGAEELTIGDEGHLSFCSPLGILNSGSPYTYQKGGNTLKEISSNYNIEEGLVSFCIDKYDENKPLIIDPTILEWSTYVGGTGDAFKYFHRIFLDGEYIYLCGFDIDSKGAYDYPTTPGSYPPFTNVNGITNLVVSKFDTLGNLQFSTYLATDNGFGKRGFFDFDEHSVFFSFATSGTATFQPGISSNAFDPDSGNKSTEIVLGRLNESGILDWSTHLGGDEIETISGFSVSNGILAIGGRTTSNDFPLFQATNSNLIGIVDLFLSKFDYNGNVLYSSYLRIPNSGLIKLFNGVITRSGYTAIVVPIEQNTIIPITQNPAPPINPESESVLLLIYDSNNDLHYSTQYNNQKNEIIDFEYEGEQLCILTHQGGNIGFTSAGAHKSLNARNLDPHLYCVDVPSATLSFATYAGTDLNEEQSTKIKIENNEVYLAGLTSGVNSSISNEVFLSKYSAIGTQIYENFYAVNADNFVDLKVYDGKSVLYAHATPVDRIFYPTPDAVQNDPLNVTTSSSYIMTTDGDGNYVYGTWISGLNTSEIKEVILDDDKMYAMGITQSGFPTTVDAFQTEFGGVVSNGSQSTIDASLDFYLLRINTALCYDDIEPNNIISPQNIMVCMNGTVPFIDGTELMINQDSIPHYLIDGVLTPANNNFIIQYQWQINFVGSFVWNDISGATGQSYQPQPLMDDANFRRIAILEYEDCFFADTSNISLVDVNDFFAPGLPPDTVYYKCESSIIKLDVTAAGGTPPYNYQWSPTTGLSNPNSPTPTTNAVESTIYVVEVTDANDCLFTEQFAVSVYQADAGDPMISCIGTGVQIGTPHVAPGVPGFSYSWSPSAGLSNDRVAQPIAFPTSPTNYTLVIIGPDNCTLTDDVLINPIQTVADAGDDVTFCFGGTVTIGETNDPEYSYAWTPGRYLNDQQISNPTMNPWELPTPNPYNYITTKIHNLTGCTDLDSVLVYVNRANAGIDFCGPRLIGSPDHSSGLANYTWTVLSGDASSIVGQENSVTPFVDPSTPTTYLLEVEWNGVVCTDQVFVPGCGCLIPVASAISDFNCLVGDVNFNTVVFGTSIDTANYTYIWTPALGIPNPTNPFPQNFTVSLASPTNYTLTSTLKSNTNISCGTSVLLLPAPLPFPFAHAVDTVTCMGEGINIGGPTISGWSAIWTPDNGTLNQLNVFNPIATPIVTSIYTVTIEESSTGCIIQDTAVVEIFDLIADAGLDKVLCENSIVQLGTEAIPGLVYSWEPSLGLENSNAAQTIDTIFATTIFYLTVSDSANTCSLTDTLTFTVVSNPNADAGQDILVCQGGQGIQIGTPAQPGDFYNWSPTTGLSDPTIAQPFASPSSTTTYTLTVSNNGEGCFSTDAILVEVTTGEAIDAGPDATVCIGEQILIGSSPSESGYTYMWSPSTGLNDPSLPQPTATVMDTITYTVILTAPTGCVVSDQITLTPSIPEVDAGEDLDTCAGIMSPIGTPGLPGYTYLWSPPTGLNNVALAQPTLTATTNQVYTLTATDNNDCIEIDEVLITVTTINVDAGPDETSCDSGVTIGGPPLGVDYTYAWSPSNSLNNPNIANPIATPSIQTTYTLVITLVSNGCTATDEVIVTPSAISNAGPDKQVCIGESIQIGTPPTSGNTYLWSPAQGLNNPNIAQPTATINRTMSYTLTVSNNGCTSIDNVIVQIESLPIIDLNEFEPICQNSCVKLGAPSNPIYRYSWFPTEGLSNPNISDPIACPTNTTIYTLLITDLNSGCTVSEFITVSVANRPQPNPFAGPDKELCPGEIANIGIGNQNSSYTFTWSPTDYLTSPFASGTQVVLPANVIGDFTYVLTAVDNLSGCSGTDTVTISMFPDPIVPLLVDQQICQNSTVAICTQCIEEPNYTYLWTPSENINNPNSLAITIEPEITTTYTLLVTDQISGCTNTNNITVEINNLSSPIADAGQDQTICIDESITLGENDNGLSYNWYPIEHRPLLSNAFISNPVFTPSDSGTFIFWVEVNDVEGCSSIDTVIVSILDATIFDAGTSFFTCATEASLEATIGNSAGEWTTFSGPNNPTITSPMSVNTQVEGLITGTYRFAWNVISNDVCNTGDFDLVTVEVIDAPTITTTSFCEIINNQSFFSYTIAVDDNGLSGTYSTEGFDPQTNLAYNQVHGPYGPFLNSNSSFNLVVNTGFDNCTAIESIINPNCEVFDFGDLPDLSAGTSAGNYETYSYNNGPSHLRLENLTLAKLIDDETEAQASSDALGDGLDEDAFDYLSFLEAIKGAQYKLPFYIINGTGNAAHLEIWVDWNADGDFDDLEEFVADLTDDTNGNFPDSFIDLLIPENAVVGAQIAFRARLSLQNNMTPNGMVQSGEVEDYLFTVIENVDICLPISIIIDGDNSGN